MKKFLSLALVTGAISLTAACSSIPECQNQDLDNCNRGWAYSDERTAWGDRDVAATPAQPPVIVEEKIVVEEEVVEAPEPAPAPAPVDTQVMQQADEPDLSK